METISITILAHNEERWIALCLESVLADAGDAPVHVIVNGSTDRTAEIARGFGVRVSVHDYAQRGKSRSWNAFVLGTDHGSADVRIFVDGDAIVAPGSFAALTSALIRNQGVNAAAGQPLNGRNVAAYRAEQAANGGLFGDLYALRGSFIDRIKAGGFRLPDDLIGDDGLIGALAKIDLVWGGEWRNDRVVVVPDAGFYAEAFNPLSLSSLQNQYKRMVNYSVRHFQNRIIGLLMRDPPPPPGSAGDDGRPLPAISGWLHPASEPINMVV